MPELVLYQRVEAHRRFVEDQQVRLMHEGLDEPDLLFVAVREIGEPQAEIEVEPFGEGADIAAVGADQSPRPCP
jgi:hypothetical protein